MSSWSQIEFVPLPERSRRPQDYLSVVIDLLPVWDFLLCMAAGRAALSLYGCYVANPPTDLDASPAFWRDIAIGSLTAALVMREPGLGADRNLRSVSRLLFAASRRSFAAFSILIVLGTATRAIDNLARLWLLGWFCLFLLSIGATRIVLASYIANLLRRGELREAVAIVGSGTMRERLAARISREADVVGLFGARPAEGRGASGRDDLARLLELGRAGNLDSIVLALDKNDVAELEYLVERLKSLPVQLAVCADGSWLESNTPDMRLISGVPVSVVADRPIKRWGLFFKTVLDKVVASLLLVVGGPVFLAIAVLIKADSPGPVIFRQKRQGWCGQTFTVFKFRTMWQGTDASSQTGRGDSRCTPIGRRLRRWSLDELPQLLNVLRGDMSLVGPRPHVESLHDIDRAGRKIIAEYAQRHRVRPGITGWAQVNGSRGATLSVERLRERVAYDLFYIEHWSLLLDLRILVRTLFCITGKNVF